MLCKSATPAYRASGPPVEGRRSNNKLQPALSLCIGNLLRRRIFLSDGLLALGAGIAGSRAKSAVASASAVKRRVLLSAFGSDGVALQRAIDTEADEVVVDRVAIVAKDVRLRSGRTLKFDGGRILVAPDAQIDQAVLDGRGTSQVRLVNPLIDATSLPNGVTAIKFFDSQSIRVFGGKLIRSNLVIDGYDSSVAREIEVTGLTLEMQGYHSTAIYISGVRGVTLRDIYCAGGNEGVGIYNNARSIQLANVTSCSHRRDGFVVIAGQVIGHQGCKAYGNGQSGFTTQRIKSGEDTRFVTWTDCLAWDNGFDGFDIRGGTERSWGIDTGFVLRGCWARANKATGFYIVRSEGTVLQSCVALRNRQQNLFINRSDSVTVDGFYAASGAADVSSGPNKAGILIYDSANVWVRGATSSNAEGRTQDFGLSFTGSSQGGRVVGGDFSDNAKPPFLVGDNALVAR